MGFLGTPGVGCWVTWVSSIALRLGAATPLTFRSTARVTSKPASKAAEMLGVGALVTLITSVTLDSAMPAHAANRLAGIMPLPFGDDLGRQHIEPQRAMARDLDRLGSFAVAGGDD